MFDLSVEGFEPVTGTPVPESGLPDKLFAFTLADDFLPPASLKNLSDAQLQQQPDLWPYGVFRKPRKPNNIPATVTTYKKASFTHSTAWLEYWASNCALAWYDAWDYNELRGTPSWDLFEKTWLWLTKGTEFLTNDKGWNDGFFDPVSGQNSGNTPMGIDALLMERNIIELVSTRREKVGGIVGYFFQCFDGSQPPPDIHSTNYRTHPWLFHEANILMGKENYVNGHMGLNPFPHGWQYGARTPAPIVCMPDKILEGGINLVPEDRIHLTDGAVTIVDYKPNSYNPERILN